MEVLELPDRLSLPKRVLLVIPKQSSYQLFLSDLAESLRANEVEVHCACSVTPSTPLHSSVQFHAIPFARGMNPIRHLSAALQLRKLVNKIRPDLVHAHFSAAIFTTAIAYKSGWPITIGTYQGLSYPLVGAGLRRLLIRWAETWASSQLNGIWVLTQDDYSQLMSDAPSANIHIQNALGFGCRIEHFDSTKISHEEKKNLRRSLNINVDELVFAFIGRFTNFKGFGLTVQAFIDFTQTFPNSKLLLIGELDQIHSSGLSELQMVQVSNHPNIRNLGWQSDVRKYLSITDAVVFPSEREGVPVSLMEASAMGIPIITMNARGCRDVVTDKVNGLLIYERTSHELVRAMTHIYEDEQLRSSLARGALAMRERFSRRHYINEQLNIYSDLTANPSA